MTEDEKKILEEEFRKAGSVPALLETMARSETKEFQEMRQRVEQGPLHPTGEELYKYVLGWLDKEESLLVMDHLLLCSTCLREVLKIRSIEEDLTEDDLAEADKVPLLDRLKGLVSKLAFPVSIHTPALEAVRGAVPEPQEHRYRPGTELEISAEAPADGYITVFHGCEETGEVELVFPVEPDDNPRVSAGQEIPSITGKVEGPPGKHWFKAFWTKDLLLNPEQSDLRMESVREEAVEEFLDVLQDVPPGDWQMTTKTYEVVTE